MGQTSKQERAFLVQVVISGATGQARAQAEKAPYPAMAHIDQYLMPDENSEIALARSAAPTSISDGAEVIGQLSPACHLYAGPSSLLNGHASKLMIDWVDIY
jgi:hypothetical protein